MARRSRRPWPTRLLRVALLSAGTLVGVVAIYLVARWAGRAFVALPLPLAVLVVAVSLTVGLVLHRALAPHRDARHLAIVRTRSHSVPDPAPVAVAIPHPPPVAAPPPRPIQPAVARVSAPPPPPPLPPRAPAPDGTTALRPYFAAWDSLGNLVTALGDALAHDQADALKLTIGQLDRASMLLTERIEADGIERQALLDALAHVANMSTAIAERIDPGNQETQLPPSRAVSPPPPPPAPAPAPRTEPAAGPTNSDPPEVGIEIADAVTGADGHRYWLRRKTDGYIFPRTFEASEIPFLLEDAGVSPNPPARS